MSIYNKLYEYLKKIYPEAECDYETIFDDYKPSIVYDTIYHTIFDIRYLGLEFIFIDGYIFSDFEEITKYINKKIKEDKNGSK